MTARAALAAIAVCLALAGSTAASARTDALQGNCGIIKVGAHHYLVLAHTVSCTFAKKTAAKLIPLKPKPLAPGATTGSLPGPKGYKCIASLGPGNSNLQLSGGCAKGTLPAIQWNRVS
jgi:hypothetical protein